MDYTAKRIELALQRAATLRDLGVEPAAVIYHLARDVAMIAYDYDVDDTTQVDRDTMAIARAIVEAVIERCEDDAQLVPMLCEGVRRILTASEGAQA